MNPTYLIAFAAGLGVILLLIGLFKKKSATQFMEGNVDVPELYLEKAVENKIRTLHHAMRQMAVGTDGEPIDKRRDAYMRGIGEELSSLKEAFRKKEFNLAIYNKKLDVLVKKLNS